MSISPYTPGISAASIPAIEYYNAQYNKVDSINSVPFPVLPANDTESPPAVVHLSLVFRDIGDIREHTERSAVSPTGIEHYIPISRNQFITAISNSFRDTPVSISSFYVLRAKLDNCSIVSERPLTIGCVRFETRSRTPAGIGPLIPYQPTQPMWQNHIMNHACMIDAARSGGHVTGMRGFWVTPGINICADYYAPPIVCSRLARAFASTVVYPNPYIRESSGEQIYSHIRDPKKRMNFKTQTTEPCNSTERESTNDVYEFIDRIGQQTSLIEREIRTMRHAAPESTLSLMQSAWSKSADYTDRLRQLLVDCRPIDHETEHFARLRVCLFGTEPVTERDIINDVSYTIRLDLDLVVFTS